MSSQQTTDRRSEQQDLSGLERRCLDLICNGTPLGKTAEKLNLTQRELEILLYYVRRRIGARSTMQAVAMCLASGILPIKDSNSQGG